MEEKQKMELDELDKLILELVSQERIRQLEKWGEQLHTKREWWLIFQEELQEMIESGYNIEEMFQVTAVMCAWMKDILKNKKRN